MVIMDINCMLLHPRLLSWRSSWCTPLCSRTCWSFPPRSDLTRWTACTLRWRSQSTTWGRCRARCQQTCPSRSCPSWNLFRKRGCLNRSFLVCECVVACERTFRWAAALVALDSPPGAHLWLWGAIAPALDGRRWQEATRFHYVLAIAQASLLVLKPKVLKKEKGKWYGTIFSILYGTTIV